MTVSYKKGNVAHSGELGHAAADDPSSSTLLYRSIHGGMHGPAERLRTGRQYGARLCTRKSCIAGTNCSAAPNYGYRKGTQAAYRYVYFENIGWLRAIGRPPHGTLARPDLSAGRGIAA